MLFMFRRCVESYRINHKYHARVEQSRFDITFRYHYMRLYKFFEPIGEDAQMHDIKVKTLVEKKVLDEELSETTQDLAAMLLKEETY